MKECTTHIVCVMSVLLLSCFISTTAKAQLTAVFSASVTEGCPSLTVNFTDNSAGSPSSWFWNFGNGKTSLQQNPTAVYDSSGTYTVTLIVSNITGADTEIKAAYIIVDTPPKAMAQAFPLEGCVPLTIDFKDSSTAGSGAIDKWQWDFGDGNSSPRPNPSNTYTLQGTYTVTLYVENTKGCKDIAVLTKNLNTGIPPVPDFTFNTSGDTICASVPVRFRNQTSGTVTGYHWDFGDDDTSTKTSPLHIFQDTGFMSVTLTAFNNGCNVSVTKDSIVYTLPPVVKIGFSFMCDSPLVRSFRAKYLGVYNINWSFGDGFSSPDSFPAHTYSSPGTYFVKLYADNPNGCTYNDSLLIPVIDEHPSFTYTALHSNFCKRDTIQFTATNYTAANMASFAWQYGDSSAASAFSGSPASTYIYTSAGTYSPQLYTTDILGCTDTISSPLLQVNIYGPTASFLNDGFICKGSSVDFADLSLTDGTHALTKWDWSFGDGTNASFNTPPFKHRYNIADTFDIQLTVTDNNACTDTILKQDALITLESPVASFEVSDTIHCFGSSVVFSDHTSGDVSSWNWNFGDGQKDSVQNTSHTYAAAGNYIVTLITSNQASCADTSFVNVTAAPLPVVNAGSDTSVCLGQTISLQPGGANNYSWQADASLSCTSCINPVAAPTASIVYNVTGTDANGCSAADNISVTVIQPFTLTVSPSDTLCTGSSLQLNAGGAFSYQWQPAAGLSNTNIASPIAKPSATSTYTVIAKDSAKCFTDTGTVTITVAPLPQFNIIDSSLSLAAGVRYILQTTSSPDVVQYTWSPAAGLSCTTCAQPEITAGKNTTYTAIAASAYGCTAQDMVTVKVLCNESLLFIPNAFSPNGDGMNDYFYPRGNGIYNIRSMRVFNKLGQVVFERTNFPANDALSGWDGFYHGKKMPQDVYVYIIEIVCQDNKIIPLKGNITIL